MPARKIEILEDRLLLVEGRDELNLFERLIEDCFKNQSAIQVLDIGGKTTLGQNLKTVRALSAARPSLRSVGIVRDSDASAVSSFRSVCDSVRDAPFSPPSAHAKFSNADPSIGIFMVPGGSTPGSIETICRNSVQGNMAAKCVDEYINCLNAHNALKSNIPDKTFTHAYLAAMNDPVARVGEAALQGVWNFHSPAFGDLRDFVHDLASR